VVVVVVVVVVLAVFGLVAAWQMYLASSLKLQIGVVVVVVVVVGAVRLLLSFVPAIDPQERREQDKAPVFPRYNPSINVFTVFFAAVLGFGLQNLLSLHTERANKTAEIYGLELLPYKWLFFLVATFIFLRFLTAAANNLWLEYQKYEREYRSRDDVYVGVGFFWITVFGCLGAYLCYANRPSEFFWRAGVLFFVTLWGSGLQWLWSYLGRTRPRGQWGWWFSLMNGLQLAAVVGFWRTGVWWDWTVGVRLLFLAVASFLILVIDFYWQLKQVAK
jgi:hypothetical protein